MRFIFFIVFVSMLSCCKEEPGLRTIPLNQEFNVQAGETFEIVNENGEYIMSISVSEINDSRCPLNAICVRAGEAKVSFQVSGIEEIIRQFELCVGADCPEGGESTELIIDNITRRFTLIDVKPYPMASKNDESKTAVVFVQ
jgi:hypothetical protein